MGGFATRSVQELNWPNVGEERDAVQLSEPLRPLQQLERGEQGAKAHSKAERLPVKVEGPNSLSRHPASICRASTPLACRGPYTPLRYNVQLSSKICSSVFEKICSCELLFCWSVFLDYRTAADLSNCSFIVNLLWHCVCANRGKLHWREQKLFVILFRLRFIMFVEISY